MKYRKAIVTFLDILGFKELVKSYSADVVTRKLLALEKYTKPLFEGGDDDIQDLLPKVFQFSDTVIRVQFTDSANNRKIPSGMFFSEILQMVFAQSDLIRNGVFLRGGMSYGDVCIVDNKVFGRAIIDAYQMESMHALYPRIALSPDLILEHTRNPFLRKHGHTVEDEYNHIRRLLRKGDDGIFYIDYARAVESELDNIDEYPLFLRHHRELIIQGAEKNKLNQNILNKYLWLATYHNSIVSMKDTDWFKYYELSEQDYLITNDDISCLHDLS